MIPISLWKHNAGWVVGVIVLPLLWYYQRSSVMDNSTPYAPRTTAIVLSGVFLSMVAGAAIGAWESVRISGLHQVTPSMRRHPFKLLAGASLPAILSLWMALLILSGLKARQFADPTSAVDWELLATGMAAQAGAVLLGFSVGILIPSFLAAPIAAVTVYGLLIVQALYLDDQLSVLAARYDECCELAQVVDPMARVGALALMAGVAIIAWALIRVKWVQQRSTASSALLLVGVLMTIVAITIPLRMENSSAMIARQDSILCQFSDDSGVEYCVWPEHAHLLADLVQTGDNAINAWSKRTPLKTPSLITEERLADDAPDAVSIGLGSSPTSDDIVNSIVWGMLGEPTNCMEATMPAFPYLAAWWLLSSGIDGDSAVLQPWTSPAPPGYPSPIEFAHLLDQADRATQTQWMAQAIEAHSTCGIPLSIDLT